MCLRGNFLDGHFSQYLFLHADCPRRLLHDGSCGANEWERAVDTKCIATARAALSLRTNGRCPQPAAAFYPVHDRPARRSGAAYLRRGALRNAGRQWRSERNGDGSKQPGSTGFCIALGCQQRAANSAKDQRVVAVLSAGRRLQHSGAGRSFHLHRQHAF